MTISRREFLGSAAAISLGFTGLRCAGSDASAFHSSLSHGFGPLLDDPEGIIALPEGFSYQIVSRWGERMSDGFYVPSRHDGMGAFAGPDGTTLLVRSHEVTPSDDAQSSAFGADLSLLRRLDPSLIYDVGNGDRPAFGGTTTLVFDTHTQTLVSHHLSLAGTLVNCAGGPTPWGSWISCEEITTPAGRRFAREHGYNFEVPARTAGPPARPIPLRAMGRFIHEAVAVQPTAGIVYQTEDLSDGLLYRFLPEAPGELARGGRLQALAVRGEPGLDTRNFRGREIEPGMTMAVEWIDLRDVEAPDDDLRDRGHAEGTPSERDTPGRLELFIEPNDGTMIENADNLTIAPWGDLVVCEDGTGDDYLVCVKPNGDIYKLARNLNGNGEFAGACFSPDGSTFFVNMQVDGWTLAITGPWASRATA